MTVENRMKVHFLSQRGDWKTPKALYQALDAEFCFDFDPCPSHPTFDGLKIEWGEVSYVNPPYGRGISQWIAKAYTEAQKGKTVVLLVPSRTDTRWFHDYCMKANEIRFIRGRLHFDDGPAGAPFPSALVIFRTRATMSETKCIQCGEKVTHEN